MKQHKLHYQKGFTNHYRTKERMMTNEQENIMYQMQYTLYGTEEWEILNERLKELGE